MFQKIKMRISFNFSFQKIFLNLARLNFPRKCGIIQMSLLSITNKTWSGWEADCHNETNCFNSLVQSIKRHVDGATIIMLLSIYFRTYLVKMSIIIKSRCSCCKAHATFNVVAASQGANARARTHLQHFFCVFFIMSTFGYQTFIAAKGAGRVLRPHSAEF